MAAATQVEVGLRRLFDKNEPELVAQWGHWNRWGMEWVPRGKH